MYTCMGCQMLSPEVSLPARPVDRQSELVAHCDASTSWAEPGPALEGGAEPEYLPSLPSLISHRPFHEEAR